jgi:hypothetical protein
VIAEVLFGATRISTFFVLIPQIGAWGCGSLIIRDLVRRRRQGWLAMLLLGMALATAEECLIQQTSLAPLVGIDPERVYGRWLGVNWVYLLWAIGYESIWAVVLPIQLTELIFPVWREVPWLSRRGLAISTLVFALASFVAWYSWTQVFVPKFFPESVYHVPRSSMAIALTAIVLLSACALRRTPSTGLKREVLRLAPSPWIVALIAFGLALPWCSLVLIAYGAMPNLPVAVPMLTGISLASTGYALLKRWGTARNWYELHRLALVFGGLAASMLLGFEILYLGGVGVISVDFIGKLVLNIGASFWLASFARNLQKHAAQASDTKFKLDQRSINLDR